MNVDSLVFNGISYGLDGTKKELKAGSDYTAVSYTHLDDGTNAEKDVLEIEGVKGTLWNTTEDDADPSTVKMCIRDSLTIVYDTVKKDIPELIGILEGICRCKKE